MKLISLLCVAITACTALNARQTPRAGAGNPDRLAT